MTATAAHPTGQQSAAASRPGPLFGDTGVLALVPERWGGMWLSRQQILTRLSRYFHILWFDPSVGWRKLWSGGSPEVFSSDATPPPDSGFTVFRQSRWLPRLYRPAAAGRFTYRQRLRGAAQELASHGCNRSIVYLWRPEYASALDDVSHDVSCYHIADEYSFSAEEHPISETERRAIERVDQVFIHSPGLMAKKGNINPNTRFVTNGVDFGSFASPAPEPEDVRSIPRPRIGYVGRIKTQLDWEILSQLAERHGDWNFVFVGPTGFMGEDAGSRDALFARSNVHYMGNRPVSSIPAYTQAMDVCMLCYRVNAYTNYIFPLKLHEYLAAGRPVVGSPIKSLDEFAPVVRIARTAEEWSRGIEESLEPGALDPERIRERRRVARKYDWDDLTAVIARTLCERLGPAYVDTFDAHRSQMAALSSEVD